MKLNIEFVREQFPALKGKWTFMDNAGGTQIAKPVIERMNDYLINSNVQLGASYKISQTATERVHEGSCFISDMINAKDSSEVIIGSSTTMLIRILARSFGQTINSGDEIIVTNCDHEANIGAWVELEKKGAVIKWWKINRDSFRLELDELRKILSDKTKLVAVTHTSNILGTLNPIKEIAELVHNLGALICVDGVAHAPHRLIDVQDLNVDFYAFSLYKVFGPHIAALYGKKELLLKLPGVSHYFIEQDDIPYKFQPGSPNYELSYGLLGIKDYFISIAKASNYESDDIREIAKHFYGMVEDYEKELSSTFLDYLNSKSSVDIVGEKLSDKNLRVPTISFVMNKFKSNFVSENVDKYKIGIRYGDFYARRLIDYLGLNEKNGVVRVSLVHYNTNDEIEKLINALEQTVFN